MYLGTFVSNYRGMWRRSSRRYNVRTAYTNIALLLTRGHSARILIDQVIHIASTPLSYEFDARYDFERTSFVPIKLYL